MSGMQSAQLEELFLLLNPSVVRDLENHHRAFDAVLIVMWTLCEWGKKDWDKGIMVIGLVANIFLVCCAKREWRGGGWWSLLQAT